MSIILFILIYLANSQNYYIKVINETEWEYKQKSIIGTGTTTTCSTSA